MGTYRLARHLASSSSLLTDTWAGLSDAGRPVLVLKPKEPWAQSAGFLERFVPWQRGWQALRNVDGMVPLVEVGEVEGAPCIVQDFVEGESLRAALLGPAPPGKPAFSVVESVAVMLQAAAGLLALRQLSPPLLHGDVCASTLWLGDDGTVRLGAVGVAAAHAADASLGPARAELLTLSPEELEGPPVLASDVFRLGLVWLELLTGKPAIGGTSYAEVKARFEKFPGVTPGHFPGLPQPIPSVLAMMLSKAPGDRPSMSDLELMLTQAWAAFGGSDAPSRPLTDAFARLFPGRVPVGSQLQGGTVITVTPVGSEGLSPGAVKLARVTTKKVSAGEVAALRASDAADEARTTAREWTLRHSREEGNPRDFSLGATLLEQQRLTVEQLDAALQNAQSLGATLFDSVCGLDGLDEDEVLPLAAGLLKQQYLTGPQLLALPLGKTQAVMMPRDAADDWQVIPLKLEAGGLTVATIDPSRLDVLDDVKVRAKARSVTGVRATQRTILEGFARIYDGKTSPPDWAKGAPLPLAPLPPPEPLSLAPLPLAPLPLAPLPLAPLPLAPLPPAPAFWAKEPAAPVARQADFELDVDPDPSFAPRGAVALSASGDLEAFSAPTDAVARVPWPSMPPPMDMGAFQQPSAWAPPPSGPAPFPAAASNALAPAVTWAPAPSGPTAFPAAPSSAPPPVASWAPPPPSPAPFPAAPSGAPPPVASWAPPPSGPAPFPAAPSGMPPPVSSWSPPSGPASHPAAPSGAQWSPPPSAPAPFPAAPSSSFPPAPWASGTAVPGWAPPLPSAPAPFPAGQLRAAPPSAPAPFPAAPSSAPLPTVPPVSAPAPAPMTELQGSLDVASRLLDALLSTMGAQGLEASRMIALVRSVAKQAGATGALLDQVRVSVMAVVIAALLEGKRPFEVPSRPAAAACLGPHWRDFEDFVRPLLDGDEQLPADPRGVVLCLCFEVANAIGAVPSSLADVAQTLDGLRSRYPLAALATLEIVLASQ